MVGIYVHIPFCRKKCPYCDFYSVKYSDCTADKYFAALKTAFDYHKDRTSVPFRADTLYFGGGTPYLFGSRRTGNLIDYLSPYLEKNTEITLEANPDTVTLSGIEQLAGAGINRISFGLQSANEQELRFLGRTHTASDAGNTVKFAHRCGIKNVSFDIMLGLHGQTKETLRNTVNFCVASGVTHISAYMLKIEPGTLFYKKRDTLDITGDDMTAELYLNAVELLEKNGFHQYEISNFALDGFESRHNMKYWTLEEYLGLGSAAHSLYLGKRFYYKRNLRQFIASPQITEPDGDGGGTDEYVMMSLRLKTGLDLNRLCEIQGQNATKAVKQCIKNRIPKNLFNLDGSKISLTPSGMLISNNIISEILAVI